MVKTIFFASFGREMEELKRLRKQKEAKDETIRARQVCSHSVILVNF